MAFFTSSLTPSTPIISSPASIPASNPFSTTAKPSKSYASTIPFGQPSSPAVNGNKRKRPSTGGAATGEAYAKREMIQSGQKNLEKLMKRVGGAAGAQSSPRPINKGRLPPAPAAPKQDPSGLEQWGSGAGQEEKKKKGRKTKRIPVGLDGRPLYPSLPPGLKVVEVNEAGEQVEAGGDTDGSDKKRRKRGKKGEEGGAKAAEAVPVAKPASTPAAGGSASGDGDASKGANKRQRRLEKRAAAQAEGGAAPADPSTPTTKAAPVVAKPKATPTPKAVPAPVVAVPSPVSSAPTPIVAAPPVAEKADLLADDGSGLPPTLQSAKFRWLNERLYTVESGEAVEMMKGDDGRQVFADYHNSHRQQTAAWPIPPLPMIVDKILALPLENPSPSSSGYLIADLGCGDADLAKKILSETWNDDGGKGKGWGKRVLSYDLVGDISFSPAGEAGGLVAPADFITSIPLPGRPGGNGPSTVAPAFAGKRKRGGKASKVEEQGVEGPEMVDVVVCCLSLMGVNWVGGIYEACRVLKKGGALHIAEVTSRLVDKDGFIGAITSFGFELETHTSPTTHFDLFQFRKTSDYPLGVVSGQAGWEARLKEGQSVMKGCVYKKR